MTQRSGKSAGRPTLLKRGKGWTRRWSIRSPFANIFVRMLMRLAVLQIPRKREEHIWLCLLQPVHLLGSLSLLLIEYGTICSRCRYRGQSMDGITNKPCGKSCDRRYAQG